MTTEDFLDILAERGKVPSSVLGQLRQKAQSGDHRVTPKAVLKYLVKKGLVDRSEAKKLLETTLIVSPNAESSILGLVPLPKTVKPQAPPPPPAAEPPRTPREEEPFPLEAVAPPAPREETFGGFTTGGELLSAAGLTHEAEHDPLLESAVTESEGEGKRGKSKKKKKAAKKDRRKQNEWDSPLILLGFGGLAALVIAGAVIYYLLIRENADKVLQEASRLFDGGSYSQSIAQYERFVKDWPGHTDASRAKVRLEMAKLWRDTDGKSDFTKALATAQAAATVLQAEPAFNSGDGQGGDLSQAKGELSELLVKIAAGLADQADAAEAPEEVRSLIGATNSALELCMNSALVPDRLRPDQQIQEVKSTLDRVERRLARNELLTQTIAAMDEAMKKGDPATAFTAHKELLKTYPLLVDDKQLTAKVREVSAAEQALVKFVAASQPAETSEAESAVAATITLAERVGSAAAMGPEGAVAVRIDGNLYGLSTRDGALLWRRSVGVGPAPVAGPADRVIAIDSVRNEVVAVDASTGKLAWRQPLGESLGAPTLRDERLLVPGKSGRLFVLDAASGELQGAVQFRQPIHVSPAFNARGDRIFVVGEHSNLYTLDAADLSCRGVYYVGHSKGSVVAPPLAVLNKVLVAENAGVETCQLHVVGLDERKAAMRPVTMLRLKGLVTTPLLTAGRRFAALTTLGEIAVFETGAGEDASAVTQMARRDADSTEANAAFGAMIEGPRETNLWVASGKLQKLAVLPTGNRLPVRTLPRDYPGDVFDHALLRSGPLVIHVRRPQGGAGAIVGAIDAQTDQEQWETKIAQPLAGAPVIDGGSLQISAASAGGGVYQLDRQALARRIQDAPLRPAGGDESRARTFTSAIDLGQGRLAAGEVGGTGLVLFTPHAPRGAVTDVPLPAPLAAPLVPLGEGFLAATSVGQVFWLNAVDGRQFAAPFQPPLAPGTEVAWLTPVVVPGKSPRFAVSDGATAYLVDAAGAGAEAALTAVHEVKIAGAALASPFALAGASIVAGDAAGNLAAFDAETFAPAEPTPLGGRIVWGPYAAGGEADGAVLAALDTGELILAAPGQGVRWRQSLKLELGGRPLFDETSVWVLAVDGTLLHVQLADGAEAGRIELGEPAIAGPLPLGPRLVAAAPDGSLLVVNRP